MLSSLKIKNFRLYWFGMFISLIGSWIQSVAQSWLVFQLTHSAFLLGFVGFLNLFPVFLLSFLGGIIADRMNKKEILLLTQKAFMALAFILALLTQMKLIKPWHIMVISVLNGIVMAFDAPSRQAVVVDLVGKQNLLNAIALNSAAFNSARIIGPALAAILIASIGMSGCFYINGISFLAVIIALSLIKLGNADKKARKTNIKKDLLEGIDFIKKSRNTLILVSMVAVISLFGLTYIILMPVFASQVLNGGVKELGILMSATGCGALSAALILAHLSDFKSKGKLLFISTILFSFLLIIFSLCKTYISSIVVLVLIGWASVTTVSLINTLLQILVPDEFRGRIMSVFMFTFAGMMPFGSLIAGGITQFFGVSWALLTGGLFCSVFFIIINIFYSDIRKI